MDKKQFSQADAQYRVDQIHAFQKEISELENDDVLVMPVEQAQAVNAYHSKLLQTLTTTYDIDINTQSKQLTLGMKIASLFGALAMAISIFFLFYQFWGYLNAWLKVSILIIAPITMLCLSLHLARKQQNRYFSKISALVALSCFVLNLTMLGQLFNISPSPNAFVIWAAFSFLLAYACNARLLLFFGIVSFSSFIAMQLGTWAGMYWINFGERPENFFIASLLLFMVPQFVKHKDFVGFDSMYRVMAMLMIFLPILILSNWGQISYLTWSFDTIEGFYQLVGFTLSVSAVWLGVKRHWQGVTHTGNIFFILFLYTKFFDWWWQWMPKYIFFFILGLSALLMLIVFKRLRLSNVREGVTP